MAEITESAMRGEINFKESFIKRIGLLKGMPESVLKGIADTLPITEGAPRLISNLKKLGYKVHIFTLYSPAYIHLHIPGSSPT